MSEIKNTERVPLVVTYMLVPSTTPMFGKNSPKPSTHPSQLGSNEESSTKSTIGRWIIDSPRILKIFYSEGDDEATATTLY